MLYQNEINLNDELKDHLHYIYMPFYDFDNPSKLDKKKYEEYVKALTSTSITDSKSFQNALLKYHKNLPNIDVLFNNLKLYEKAYPEEANVFFNDILPFIIEQALKLPEYFKTPIPLLEKYMNIAITINKLQAISLLSNQFLCIFTDYDNKYSCTPFCSFLNLLSSYRPPSSSCVEKIRCIIHYFDKMRKKSLDTLKSELITYQRVSVNEDSIPNWISNKANICQVIVDKNKSIEDCDGMLQVDFANCSLGGGVLRGGCVQEEIRFSINPELIVSMVFTQLLEPLESVYLIGSERTSQYTGYGSSFKYNNDYDDTIKFDQFNRKLTEIVAIDAKFYNQGAELYQQYSKKDIDREINKLYSGFKDNELSNYQKNSFIATGNWGCGAFNGNIQLKSLVQILVASVVGKNIYYCPFNKTEFASQLEILLQKLKSKQTT
ncbi:hypothetical protein BCR36DRAFT_331857, partial [Piromyces finnis]